MKRLFLCLLFFILAGMSTYAQEQIGTRLKYEIISARAGSCMVAIQDVYDQRSYLFFAKQNINNIYNITTYMDERIGTANLYTDEFRNLITNYILSTLQAGAHSEWRTYASTIAEKFEQLVKRWHPHSGAAPLGSTQPAPAAPMSYNEYLFNADITLRHDNINISTRHSEYIRVIELMTEAIRYYPNHPDLKDAYDYRGSAYELLFDYDNALADYNQLISLDPNESAWYSRRARVYSAKGDHNRAIIDYTKAIDLWSKMGGGPNENFHFNRGKEYQIQGDYNRAIADFETALRRGDDMGAEKAENVKKALLEAKRLRGR